MSSHSRVIATALLSLIPLLIGVPTGNADPLPQGSPKNLKLQGIDELSVRVERGKLRITSVSRDTLDPTPGRYSIPAMPSSHIEVSTDRASRELWIRASIDLRDWKQSASESVTLQVPGLGQPVVHFDASRLAFFIPAQTRLQRSLGPSHLFDDGNRLIGTLTPIGEEDNGPGLLLTIDSARL